MNSLVEPMASGLRLSVVACLAFGLLLSSLGSSPSVALSQDSIEHNQVARDQIFATLRSQNTDYKFDYIVLYLPSGTISGINFPIPVSHIRFEGTIFFDFDSSEILPTAERIVDKFSKAINSDRSLKSILVVGHTDSIGPDAYNTALSLRRATEVVKRLQNNGVEDGFMGVVPMGEAQPIATNRTKHGQSQNRRVEFFLSEVPDAAPKVIERIPFDPCFRNDHAQDPSEPRTDCETMAMRIPIYPGSTNSLPPTRSILLPGASPTRPPIPSEVLTRPSLVEELQAQDD